MRMVRICALLAAAIVLRAETGHDAWLRYSALSTQPILPDVVVALGDSPLLATAKQELIRGLRSMTGRTLRIENAVPIEPAIVLATLDDLQKSAPQWRLAANGQTDGFLLKTLNAMEHRHIIVTAPNARGVQYGTFTLLRKTALGESIEHLDAQESPYAPLRWGNQWDNSDGSIERGYGGRSIFWENDHVRTDLTRVSEYGRLLASLGINACSINNVNADPRVITPEFLPQVAKIADALRPWGVQLALAVDFGSPEKIGKLDTFDPLDPRVAAWWKAKIDEIY